MKKKWIWIAVVGVVVVAAGAGYLIIRNQTARSRWQNHSTQITRTAQVTLGSLSDTVGASGAVRSGQSDALDWETSGRVAVVNVSAGQVVKAGDVLAELDQTSLPDDNIKAQADLIAAQQDLQNLQDSQTAASKAYDALLNAQDDYDSAKYHVDSISAPRTDADTLELAEISYQRAQATVDRLAKMYGNMSNLSPDDPQRASLYTQLTRAQQTRDNALAKLNWYKGSPTDSESEKKQAALMVAKAALEDAQRNYDRLKDGPDPDDIKAAQARVDSAQAVIDQYKIVAPFDATVTEADATPGDLVSKGNQAFRLDDLTRVYIDLQVSEVDINRVEVGQDCAISFDAISNQAYHGKVSVVGAVGKASSGVVYFPVTVEVSDADAQVKPGMTAVVDITVETHDGILLVPTRAITDVDGKKMVTLVKDGQATQIEVTLGMTSGQNTEITSANLQAGDEVQYTVTPGTFGANSSQTGEEIPFGGGMPPELDGAGGPPNGAGQPPAGGGG